MSKIILLFIILDTVYFTVSYSTHQLSPNKVAIHVQYQRKLPISTYKFENYL